MKTVMRNDKGTKDAAMLLYVMDFDFKNKGVSNWDTSMIKDTKKRQEVEAAQNAILSFIFSQNVVTSYTQIKDIDLSELQSIQLGIPFIANNGGKDFTAYAPFSGGFLKTVSKAYFATYSEERQDFSTVKGANVMERMKVRNAEERYLASKFANTNEVTMQGNKIYIKTSRDDGGFVGISTEEVIDTIGFELDKVEFSAKTDEKGKITAIEVTCKYSSLCKDNLNSTDTKTFLVMM